MSNLSHDLALALSPTAFFEAATGATPDAWQRQVLASRSRRLLLACCRQAGKSTVCSALALREAMYRPGSLTLILAPALRQSQELFRKVVDAYLALGAPIPTTSATTTQIVFENRSRIVALPGESDATIRSYSSVGLLLVDEAARVDDSLLYAVRPMLAVSRGRLVGLSTPFGRRGWFFNAWTGDEAWQRIRVTWRDVPRLDPSFIEEERRAMPRMWFDSEYEVEFVDSADALFASADVDAAFTASVRPLLERLNDD